MKIYFSLYIDKICFARQNEEKTRTWKKKYIKIKIYIQQFFLNDSVKYDEMKKLALW
jgi:hypothetical protein